MMEKDLLLLILVNFKGQNISKLVCFYFRRFFSLLNFSFCIQIVKYERIKFLIVALEDSIEVYAWAPKPYHKFMTFKVFSQLIYRPLLVDLTIEEGSRLKVIYGSTYGFHAIDLDTSNQIDIYLPSQVFLFHIFFFNDFIFS